MLRKICACFIIISLGLSQIYSIYAYTSPLSLKKQQEVDTILEGFSLQKLGILEERISKNKKIISTLSQEKQDILYYIQIQIEKKNLGENISTSDALYVEKEMMQMQQQISKTVKETLTTLILRWKKMSSYEEKGDLDITFEANIPSITQLDGKMSLSNYKTKNREFQQELTGEIETFIHAVTEEKEIESSIKSLIHYISLDENIYLLLKQLSVTNSDPYIQEKYNSYIEEFKKLAKNNTYISFPNKDAEKAFKVISQYSPDTLIENINQAASQPLFEAYAKKGDTYLLRPSKYFCGLGKQMRDIFDPFNGDICSDGQYKKLLKKFQDSGIQVFLTLGKNKKIQISFNAKDTRGTINILGDSRGISQIDVNIYDPMKVETRNIQGTYIPKTSLLVKTQIDTFLSKIDIKFSPEEGIKKMLASAYIADSFMLESQYQDKYMSASLQLSKYKDTLSCSIKGPLEKDYAKIYASCEGKSKKLANMVEGEDTINIASDFSLNTRGSKNNLSFSSHANIGEMDIFKIGIQNIGTRIYSNNLTIYSPKKSKPYTEIREKLSQK